MYKFVYGWGLAGLLRSGPLRPARGRVCRRLTAGPAPNWGQLGPGKWRWVGTWEVAGRAPYWGDDQEWGRLGEGAARGWPAGPTPTKLIGLPQ